MEKTNKRTLKAGSVSLIATAILVLALLLVNMIVGEIPTKYTKLDTSSIDILTLTDESLDIIDSVTEEVTFYLIAETGNEDEVLYEFVKRYADRNPNIKLKTVYPAVNPTFVEKYTDDDIGYGSVIVESKMRSKVVPYDEMYLYITEYGVMTDAELSELLMYAAQYGVNLDYTFAFYGEVYVSGALDYVTAENVPVIYTTAGHGEISLPENYLKYLGEENYEVKELKLIAEGKVPADASLVVIHAPTSDITADEAEILTDYIKGGGNVMLDTLYSKYSAEKMPNLVSVTAALGMEAIDGVVIDTDKQHYYQAEFNLLPEVGNGGLIDDTNYYVLLSSAHGLKATDGVKNVTVKPLLKTSDKSYVKVSIDENTTTFEKGEGDVDGPVLLGAVGEYADGTTVGRLVWFASPSIADDSMDYYSGYGNSTMYISIANALAEKEASVSIIAKEYADTAMVMTSAQVGALAVIFVIVIPAAVLFFGFYVWYRRRRS